MKAEVLISYLAVAVACSGFAVAVSLTAENPNIVYRNLIIIIINIFVDLKICLE